VGKKTAERLVVELKDRMPAGMVPDGTAPPASPAGGVRDDLLSALTNLGYQRHAVEKTIDRIVARADSSDFEVLLRAVLREMSRS
jgi:Holliday junction DNA helicase RuvA